TAYVHGDYIRTSAPTNGTVTAPLVNLRADASSTAAVLGTAAQGTQLTVLRSIPGWYQVTNGSLTAYIVADYLAVGEVPPTTTPVVTTPESTTSTSATTTTSQSTTTEATTPSPAGFYGTVTGSVVNLRSGASTTSTIVGKATQGERYLIVAQDGDWYQITLEGQPAYIHRDYVELDDPDAFTHYGTVTGGAVNVRAGAGSWHAKLGQVVKNERVKILGEENGWYKIETASGQVGYVSGEYIAVDAVVTEPTETTPAETEPPTTPSETTTVTTPMEFIVEPLEDTGVITGSYVNLRALPSTESSVVALIAKGKYVDIIGSVGADWYQVNYGSLTGYISATYLEPGMIAYTRPIVNLAGGAGGEGLISQFGSSEALLTLAEEICQYAKTFIGTPYVYGGSLPETGFDCSGFTKYVYAHFGIEIPRMQQYDAGVRVEKENLRPGDLVFFNTTGYSISHVGMYIGYGQFIHAPTTGKTVCITDLDSDYYAVRFVCATRILN
ncbi:MAG: SH3 domain-containing protein, partial [Clostridia bacterium]|nr:SH3 domain-containing protein [Clostridia bacterium]